MKWVALSLTTLLFVSCTADKHKNAWTKLCLKGSVKQMEELEYTADRKSNKKSGDSIIRKCSYAFNNRGNIAVEYTWLPSGHIYKCVFQFDDRGKPIQARKYMDDTGFCYKAVFRYDKEGLLAGQDQYDKRDSINIKMRYRYDARANLAEETSYWSTGRLLCKYTYAYNSKGQDTACNFYNADTALILRTTSRYNDSGYVQQVHKYGEEDEKGWLFNYEYNAYDKRGNWLQRTTYVGEKAVSITQRTITYY